MAGDVISAAYMSVSAASLSQIKVQKNLEFALVLLGQWSKG